jgi:hypothetical protein
MNLDDEGYQDSARSSLLSSLPSDVKSGKLENGWLFANFSTYEYTLPIDNEEQNRLDLNHAKYYLIYSIKEFLSLISDNF